MLLLTGYCRFFCLFANSSFRFIFRKNTDKFVPLYHYLCLNDC
ncbi:hypothetical protein HMPREF1981_01243 [Bacteroides pyogenes F0041]|uniref:Uncharacterized protein n=1 Tax=Bacteroides pyogenes F0041 TaxID=1321819 RepID=U2CP92_9BACE|nr:hypothetical protein HMPREF1981_01243 [Bacteroides pyogenes F0041]